MKNMMRHQAMAGHQRYAQSIVWFAKIIVVLRFDSQRRQSNGEAVWLFPQRECVVIDFGTKFVFPVKGVVVIENIQFVEM